jgi:hypothetical protein
MEKGPQVTLKSSGPIGQMEMEKGPIGTRDMQAVGSHRSDGYEERSHGYTWYTSCRVPQVGWRWRKVPQVHVTRKSSGPTGQMEKGPTVHVGWTKDQAKTFMMNCEHHGWVTAGPRGTCRMEKGPTGTHWMEKGPSRDFMMNCQRHGWVTTSPTCTCRIEKGPCGGLWQSVVRYRSDIVCHRCVISSMTKPCSS